MIIITCAIPLLLPFFWLISSSLKTYNRVYHYPPEWLPIIENFHVDSHYQQQSLLVNIIDKNQDTGTEVFRVRILGTVDDEDLLIPQELIHTEIRQFEVVEIDGIEYEIERMSTNNKNGQVLIKIINVHPQIEVDPRQIIIEADSQNTIYLFRQNIRVKIIEQNEKRTRIQIVGESKPFYISLQKLNRVDENRGSIEILSELLPVQILEINRLANIALIKLIPSAKLLGIENNKIIETRETKYFFQARDHRYPIKWVKRGEPSIVRRLDLPYTMYVSSDQLRTKVETRHFTNLYGQRVELRKISTSAGWAQVKILDPIYLDAQFVKAEQKFSPQWQNYVDVIQKEPFHYYLLNTVFIALASILGQVLSCSIVGYAFARIRFPGRDFLFIILLSTLMLPHQVIMIPQFILYVKLGWLDTFKPLIVPTFLAQSAFFVFLFRQYFMTIPLDLDDAAKIDGCSPLYTYWHIMLPLAKPVIVSVAVFTFMWTWNDFLYPLLYLNSDEHQTLALALENFKTAFGLRDPHFLMAASTMMVIPSIIIFFLAQKAFIRGVVMTGVKG